MIRTPSFWQTRGLVSILLLPVSLFYYAGFRFDRAFTDTQKAPLPVISVGNVTAGGAGKTPTAIALAKLLQTMGEMPHILSRGYGGSIAKPHRVDPAQDSFREVGDEALLLAAIAPTWIARKRIEAARAAQQDGASVLIADDALQHHALHHDLSILVIDGAYGFGNGFMLPAGPLREPVKPALRRPNTLALIVGETSRPLPTGWRAQLQPAGDTSFLRGQRWLAFAGIAHPQKFFDGLRKLGAAVEQEQSFPDHHPFSAQELAQLRQRAEASGLQLITTEKDAVRIDPQQRHGIATLPVTLQWSDPAQVQAELRARLNSLRSA